MMRRSNLLGVACLACALSHAAAFGAVVNVDFNGVESSGTYSGVGAAPDAGTFWNGYTPTGNPSTSGPLFDSLGVATPVTVTLQDYQLYDADERPAAFAPALLNDFVYQPGPVGGVGTGLFTINNLTPDAVYDLYLYTQNGGYSTTSTRFNVNGTNKTAVNTNGLFSGGFGPASFIENTNYILYSGIPATGGSISGTFMVAINDNAAFNGLQIVGATGPPPPPPPPSLKLNENIGSNPGDYANDFMGAGNRVNLVGTPSNAGPTTLAQGPGTLPTFDFNSGFSDSQDRTIGVSPNSGAKVPRDRKFDSVTPSPLILDTDNDGDFADETAQPGFGMHADAFITFDLALIRSENGLAADQALILTGEAGIANFRPGQQFGNFTDSAAILVDGQVYQLFDSQDTPTDYFQYDTTNLIIPGSARYLTFAGLVGTDFNISGAHLGFANMTLAAVPEPSTFVLAGVGLLALLLRRRRK